MVSPSASTASVANLLIEGLPHGARSRLLKLCDPIELEFGTIVCEADQRLKYVYFPVIGSISLVAKVENHPPLEIGLIGNEGMLGATLALDVSVARLQGVVQGSGSALRMTAAQLRSELRDNSPLRRMLKRYLFVLLAQLSQSTACGRFHEIKARLARWLLMTHDRAHADHFQLTHQYLADMLGVQRSAITIAAGALQRKKLISYKRGDIVIVNRRGLEATSCECYQALVDDHNRLFA
jgi:CRP-like cAMP-binding protein